MEIDLFINDEKIGIHGWTSMNLVHLVRRDERKLPRPLGNTGLVVSITHDHHGYYTLLLFVEIVIIRR